MKKDEVDVDLRRTNLFALTASLSDVRRSLYRAARIHSSFSAELRALLLVVVDLDRRVITTALGSEPASAPVL